MSKQTDLINVTDAITVSGSNVGIGTTSPSRQLHLSSSTPIIRLTDTDTNAYGEISSSSSDGNLMFFADQGNTQANTTIRFYVDTTERMRIDTSGRLLVGMSSSSSTAAGFRVIPNDFMSFTTTSSDAGDRALLLNRQSSDGTLLEFKKANSAVGSIGTNGSTLYIGSKEGSDAHIGFGNQIIRPVTSSGGSRDNAIDLGYNGMRFRDIYLSGGIYLGGTGSANKLEDYEEGTHQTVATMTTSGTVTLNTSFDRISYTKVGRLVTIIGNPRITTVSSPVGQLRFTLPFTAISGQTDECRAGFISNYYDNTGGSGSYSKQVNATVNEGTNHLTLDLINSHNNNITADSSDEVLFSFSYFTTS